MVKSITTTISEEYYTFCKERGIGWHEAICKGIHYLMEGKNVEAELMLAEQKISRISIKLAETNQRIWDLEKKSAGVK